MSLTCKDCNELARIVREKGTDIEMLTSAIASFCYLRNPDFNRQSFLDTCQPRKKSA